MKEKILHKFGEVFGDTTGVKTYFAPGRVNLIGEHTDYNGGHVFPCALTIGTYGAARQRADKMCIRDRVKGRLYGYCSSEGEALSIGEVKYRNSWDTEDLSIVLYLGSDNYEITFSIIYDSKTLDHPDGVGLNQ